MIKALSIMKLLQVIKRYIRQSGLNFQKCYERDQNMRAGGRGPGAEGHIIGPWAGGWINLIAYWYDSLRAWFSIDQKIRSEDNYKYSFQK